MIVLGLCIGEFSSACIVVDGKVVGASYEERFHRRKCLSGFPYKAVEYLLASAGIGAEDVDLVRVMNETRAGLEFAMVQRLNSFSVEDYVREAHDFYRPTLYEGKKVRYLDVFAGKIERGVFPTSIEETLLRDGETESNSKPLRTQLICAALGRKDVKVEFVEHHLSHALYGDAFLPARETRRLIFTADSFGDYSNANVYSVSESGFNNLHTSATHNLGRLFRNVTLLLGMKPYQHEYKVMGLAPYSAQPYSNKVKEIFRSFMRGFENGDWAFTQKPKDHYFLFRDLLEGHRFDSIAGGLQEYFEEMLLSFFEYYLQRHRDHDAVVFSGGLSMNVKANMLLAEKAGEYGMSFYAAPSGDDYSHCISAALGAFPGALAGPRRQWLDSLALGSSFAADQIDETLSWARRSGWSISEYDPAAVAERLADGDVLALCHGRAEFGARALGFRSIIADPRDADTIRRINIAIKQRDFWMPFAPATIDGHERDYFDIANAEAYRYMALAARTTERGKANLGAAIHPYDQTARPQIVRSGENRLFHEIIEQFGRKTGTFALLNTSLNLHGYPIVNDAKDLIWVLENSALDGCVMDGWLITRATRTIA